MNTEEKTNEFKKSVDENIKTKLITLDGRLNIALEEAVKRGEVTASDRKIIKDCVEEAFAYGKASNMAKEEAQRIFGNFEDIVQKIFDPETEKYKQLYFNQKLITTNLISVAQLLQMQITINGDKENPVLGLVSGLGIRPSADLPKLHGKSVNDE